jgi:hypothetical protein
MPDEVLDGFRERLKESGFGREIDFQGGHYRLLRKRTPDYLEYIDVQPAGEGSISVDYQRSKGKVTEAKYIDVRFDANGPADEIGRKLQDDIFSQK